MTGARNDGVQEGADRSRRRHARRPRSSCASRAAPRRARPRAASPPKAWSAPTFRATRSSARWSSSTARPTSSRKNDDFLALRAQSLAETGRQAEPGRRGRAVGAADSTADGRSVRQRWSEDRREHLHPPLQAPAGQGQAGASTCTRQQIGVMVDYEGADESSARTWRCTSPSSKPAYLSKADVPAERRRSASATIQLAARARNRASRRRSLAKMVEGARATSSSSEVTLLGQPFVKDDKQTIEQMLDAKKAQGQRLAFFVVGEGIEKKRATSRPK